MGTPLEPRLNHGPTPRRFAGGSPVAPDTPASPSPRDASFYGIVSRTKRYSIASRPRRANRCGEASFPAIYRGGVDPDLGPRCVPVVRGDRVIVYGAAGDLHAVAVDDGRTLWSRQLGTDYRADEGYFGAGSTPLVVDSLVIVAVGGQPDAGLVAVGLDDGKTRWAAIDSEAAYASPVTDAARDAPRGPDPGGGRAPRWRP